MLGSETTPVPLLARGVVLPSTPDPVINPLSFAVGTVIPESTFPSRRSEEEAEARPRPPLRKGKGRVVRAAFWEPVVFWERGRRHSLASRLRGRINFCHFVEKEE